MVAPSSTSSRLSGASGWTEVAGSDGLLLLEGVRPPQARTVESGAVSGTKPDLEPWGFHPLYSWGPEDCLAAPPGPPPPALFDGAPLRRRSPGWGRLRAGRSPCATNPGSRSTNRRVRPAAGCTNNVRH